MRRFSAVYGLLACFYSVATCADYQTELGFGYSQHKTRAHPDIYSDWVNYNHVGQQIYLHLYFDPVSTEGKPLSDAAFLDRSSHLRLTQDKLDFDAGVSGAWSTEPSVDVRSAPDDPVRSKSRAIEGFWTDDDSDFALRLGYARYEDSFISASKFKAYLLGIGYYLSDSSYLELQYQKYSFSDEPAAPPPRSSNPETYQLLYKNVLFSGQRAVTDIEFQVSKTPFGENMGASLAWFAGASSKFGLRVAMHNRDRMGLPSYHYGAFYDVFFDQQWLVRLTYDTGRHGVASEDPVRVTEHNFGMVLAIRF